MGKYRLALMWMIAVYVLLACGCGPGTSAFDSKSDASHAEWTKHDKIEVEGGGITYASGGEPVGTQWHYFISPQEGFDLREFACSSSPAWVFCWYEDGSPLAVEWEPASEPEMGRQPNKLKFTPSESHFVALVEHGARDIQVATLNKPLTPADHVRAEHILAVVLSRPLSVFHADEAVRLANSLGTITDPDVFTGLAKLAAGVELVSTRQTGGAGDEILEVETLGVNEQWTRKIRAQAAAAHYLASGRTNPSVIVSALANPALSAETMRALQRAGVNGELGEKFASALASAIERGPDSPGAAGLLLSLRGEKPEIQALAAISLLRAGKRESRELAANLLVALIHKGCKLSPSQVGLLEELFKKASDRTAIEAVLNATDPKRAAGLELQAFKQENREPTDLSAGRAYDLLHLAVQGDNAEVVQWLLDHGRTAGLEESLLPEACQHGSEEVAALLIGRLAPGVKPKPDLLAKAVESGNVKVVELLARTGIDLRQYASLELPFAVRAGNREMTDCLLKLGADASRQNCVGEAGSPEMVRLLAKAGAPLDGHSPGGDTPLGKACAVGHFEVAAELIELGATVKGPADARSPLSAAAGNLKGSTFLLDHGADPNDGGAGDSPLHAAVMLRNLDVVKLLVSHGAIVRHPGNNFLLIDAVRMQSADIVRYLLAHGADKGTLPTDAFFKNSFLSRPDIRDALDGK